MSFPPPPTDLQHSVRASTTFWQDSNTQHDAKHDKKGPNTQRLFTEKHYCFLRIVTFPQHDPNMSDMTTLFFFLGGGEGAVTGNQFLQRSCICMTSKRQPGTRAQKENGWQRHDTAVMAWSSKVYCQWIYGRDWQIFCT